MAYLSVPIDTAGGVTTPTGVLPLTLPVSDSSVLDQGLPSQVAEPPGARMLAIANGFNRLVLLTRDTFVNAGGLAPSTAPTVALSGVRATVVETFSTGLIADGSGITLGRPGAQRVITFKTTLVTDGTLGDQVKLGADLDATATNLYKLITGTGTQGSEYFNVFTYLGLTDDFPSTIHVEASALDTSGAGATVTLRYTLYGTIGNSCVSVENGAGFANHSFASATFTGGTDGSGSAPDAGTYRYFYTHYRDLDGAETGPSPVGEITKTTNENISLSVLTANADTSFDYTRVYRTRDTGVEFLLCKTIARASTTVTDDISDDRLEDFSEFPYNENLYQTYRGGFPPIGRYIAVWKNRLWTGGAVLAAAYTVGTAAVTKTTTGLDNNTVTITTGYPVASWVMRTFQVSSTSEKYLILAVNEATKVITLDRGYEGTTNATASYTVRDERDPSQIYGSEPGLWNQWPPQNNPGGVDTDDQGGVSGLVGFEDALVVTSRSSVYRLTGDDENNWQFHKAVEGCGCAEGRTLVDIDGYGLMWLGWAGIYAWDGRSLPVLISSPKRRGKFVRGIDDTIARINWPHVAQAFAHYSEQERVVRFFVPLDNDTVPNHAIVLEIDAPGEWSLDYFPGGVMAAGTVIGPDGKPATLLGDPFGNVFQVGLGSYDTVPDMSGIEPVVTLTAGTVRTATQGGTTWPTTNTGLAGVPALIVYANGTAAATKIASNTSSVLTFTHDLDTAPANGDQVVVGGIWTRWRSGKFALEEDWSAKVMRDLVVSHSPEADGQYHVAVSSDQSDPAIPTTGYSAGDLTDTTGRRRFRPQTRGQLHQIEYNLLEPGTTGHIRGHQIAVQVGSPQKDPA